MPHSNDEEEFENRTPHITQKQLQGTKTLNKWPSKNQERVGLKLVLWESFLSTGIPYTKLLQDNFFSDGIWDAHIRSMDSLNVVLSFFIPRKHCLIFSDIIKLACYSGLLGWMVEISIRLSHLAI